jgi:hypothetical protein
MGRLVAALVLGRAADAWSGWGAVFQSTLGGDGGSNNSASDIVSKLQQGIQQVSC